MGAAVFTVRGQAEVKWLCRSMELCLVMAHLYCLPGWIRDFLEMSKYTSPSVWLFSQRHLELECPAQATDESLDGLLCGNIVGRW